jgi:hypothetical protein
LVVLKIEVLARVADPLATLTQGLVVGHGSFRFGLNQGALEAGFENASGSNNYVRSADAFAPDGMYHPVPSNKWVKLGFYHDGFAKMRLFIEGQLVGEAIVDGGVPPVQGLGVSIGNAVDVDGQQFAGEIDELQIWRHDPKNMKREFLGRPYTNKTARCWEHFFRQILNWAKLNPETLKALSLQVADVQNSFIRALFLLPDSDQARVRAMLIRLDQLWFAGDIDGPEMETALRDWIVLLRSVGIDPFGEPTNPALAAAIAKVGIDGRDLLKCDPKIAKFLDLLRNAAEKYGKTAEAPP